MKKNILYGSEARQKLKAGIDKSANAVKVTMGARGRTVGLSHGHFTKDGVSVARDIELPDVFENKGAQLLKAASIKTNDVVGDGTTVTAVLAQALVGGGFDLIEKGKDAQELRREMEDVKPEVLKLIEKSAHKITDVKQVATISANDEVIGDLVSQAVNKVGADGLITVEYTYKTENEVEIVSGMQIDKGVQYPVFYTDQIRRRAEFNQPIVVLYDGDIHDVQGFFTMLTPALAEGKAIVVFANSFDPQVLHNMLLLRVQKGMKILPVTNPHVYREEVIEDMAVYTGAQILKEGDALEQTNIYEVCGTVESIFSTPERTVMRSNGENDKAITKRIAYIHEHAKTYKDAERRNVEQRASRLNGKIAIIRTHSVTEEEAKEKRDRFDDAIFASQAALRQGVVTGGGMTFLMIADKIKGLTDGARVIKDAFEAPMRQIAANAGRKPTEVIASARSGKGYNAKTDEYCDLDKAGIIDPAAVLTHAFENSLSVALLAITTEALIAEHIVEKE